VSPVMEVLADEYKKLNPNVTIEIQQNGSSAGISSAIEGVCDLGMSSRELTDSEKAKLKEQKIAMDGIAIIVNNANSIKNLTSEQIQKLFKGEITNWNEVK
ncbi:MAG: substrate-binding domain-containing protein, partial [Bacillota bacterium]|nr:substrate-binding domain-containing protein [Bacillota bacterium]